LETHRGCGLVHPFSPATEKVAKERDNLIQAIQGRRACREDQEDLARIAPRREGRQALLEGITGAPVRPAASPAEVNEQVGGEDAEDGLVVHYGPDGLPHAFEIEHASERPELVARALSALRHAKGFAGDPKSLDGR
jgi:hypothetical protein